MPVKKAVKKAPSKQEIENAAASVEAAIERLEIDEVHIESETVTIPEESKEAPKVEEKAGVEETVEVDVPVEEEPEEVKEVAADPEVKSEEVEAASQDSPEETVEESSKEEPLEDVPVESRSRGAFIEDTKSGGSKSKVVIVICLCIIFTILGFFGGYVYTKNTSDTDVATSKSPDIVIESSPTPIVAEVNLSDYSIEVLNGSGVAGVAGTEQVALETDGFNVENTGNAENQDFTETVISVKSSVSKEYIEKLKDSLSERYVVASDTEDLESDSDYDVVVTVGSETVVDE